MGDYVPVVEACIKVEAKEINGTVECPTCKTFKPANNEWWIKT